MVSSALLNAVLGTYGSASESVRDFNNAVSGVADIEVAEHRRRRKAACIVEHQVNVAEVQKELEKTDARAERRTPPKKRNLRGPLLLAGPLVVLALALVGLVVAVVVATPLRMRDVLHARIRAHADGEQARRIARRVAAQQSSPCDASARRSAGRRWR